MSNYSSWYWPTVNRFDHISAPTSWFWPFDAIASFIFWFAEVRPAFNYMLFRLTSRQYISKWNGYNPFHENPNNCNDGMLLVHIRNSSALLLYEPFQKHFWQTHRGQFSRWWKRSVVLHMHPAVLVSTSSERCFYKMWCNIMITFGNIYTASGLK